MTQFFTVYDANTGRGKRTGWTSSGTPQAREGEDQIWGTRINTVTQRIDPASGEILNRRELEFDKIEITADGSDATTLTGLPDPCTVLIDGEPQEVTGGTLEFSADTPGEYEVEVRETEAFPAQAFSGTVTAT